MPVMSEQELLPVREAREGNPEAWAALLARFRLPLYAYIHEWVHHEQTTLDLVQETFINAARHIGSLREDGKFASWLFHIAQQKCIQHWRNSKRYPEPGDIEIHERTLVDESPDPGEWLVRREDEEQFMKHLQELPLPQRSALMLHFLEGFSLEEIAEVTGAQVGTVKSRLHYAKKTMRQILEENRK